MEWKHSQRQEIEYISFGKSSVGRTCICCSVILDMLYILTPVQLIGCDLAFALRQQNWRFVTLCVGLFLPTNRAAPSFKLVYQKYIFPKTWFSANIMAIPLHTSSKLIHNLKWISHLLFNIYLPMRINAIVARGYVTWIIVRGFRSAAFKILHGVVKLMGHSVIFILVIVVLALL